MTYDQYCEFVSDIVNLERIDDRKQAADQLLKSVKQCMPKANLTLKHQIPDVAINNALLKGFTDQLSKFEMNKKVITDKSEIEYSLSCLVLDFDNLTIKAKS